MTSGNTTTEMDGNRTVKEQLKIPLTEDEIKKLSNGGHVKVRFSDDSPHKEMVLFEDTQHGDSR